MAKLSIFVTILASPTHAGKFLFAHSPFIPSQDTVTFVASTYLAAATTVETAVKLRLALLSDASMTQPTLSHVKFYISIISDLDVDQKYT